MSEPTDAAPHTRKDVHALAEAFVSRMRWPSMHWSTQHLDFDAAAALALVALEHGPEIIAAARIKEQAATRAMSGEVTA